MKATQKLGIGMITLAGLTPAMAYEADWFEGKVLLDGRLRYEMADQTGLKESDALTYRLRFGYELELNEWVKFLAEGEGNIDLAGDYDPYPGGQGEPGYAIIADPQNLELNRMHLTIGIDPVTAVLGRQRIVRNNARFIGNVGWRQNEQTFDAAGISYRPVKQFELYYAYLEAANRIFGIRADASVQRQFELDSHIVEAQYDVGNGIKAGAYGYFIGIENSAGDSSDTIGLWASGTTTPGENGLSIEWRAEYAEQTENNYSPDNADFSLGYCHLTAGLSKKGLGGLSLGYEILEGDGSRGFSTPLATLHAFNGFADVFLSTPSNGLTDLYLKASIPVAEGISAALFYHDFEADHGSTSYGEEYDAVLSWKINGNLSVTAKAAYFDGEDMANVAKIWLQLDMLY